MHWACVAPTRRDGHAGVEAAGREVGWSNVRGGDSRSLGWAVGRVVGRSG